jgi:arginase
MKMNHSASIAQYSQRLAEAVKDSIEQNYFPLVIGGDCSVLLGNMLALRSRGKYGLLFIDGHNDFQTPEQSASKGVAGMDLSLVTGRGPDALTNINGLKPYVEDANVVVLGDRYEDSTAAPNQAIRSAGISVYPLSILRKSRLQHALDETMKKFQENNLNGIWVHFDTDVLNDEIMPAVDSRQPEGLWYDELELILRSVFSSGMVVGMDVTIYDPDLDPSGKYAAALIESLGKSFKP